MSIIKVDPTKLAPVASRASQEDSETVSQMKREIQELRKRVSQLEPKAK